MSDFTATADLTPSLIDDVLITIRPVHASRIYGGSKLFEFRKTIPRIVPRRMFLFETGDVAAVTGHIIVESVLSGAPQEIWDATGEIGTARASFERYFNGKNRAYAYKIAEAVRYKSPLTKPAILQLEPGYRSPQHFLYLQHLPALRHNLVSLAVEESFGTLRGALRLPKIENRDVPPFRRLVKRHISKSYFETGTVYADKLLAVAEAGDDAEGFLTLSKSIRAIHFKKKCVGYVVVTFKHGGSVKTGPVILAEDYRQKGVGKALRTAIHTAVRRVGYRKVFGTVPSNNPPAYQYLLSSGYRVEAHLNRAYHSDNDEFVLGRILFPNRGTGPEFVRQLSPTSKFNVISRPSPEHVSFLAREFVSAYCSVPEDWAQRQLKLACAGGSNFKPRFAFAAFDSALLCVAICILKRGGSAKLIVLSRTGHQLSLTGFIDYIIEQVTVRAIVPIRRFYTQVPLKDSDMIQAYSDAGFSPEGVIQQPFSPNVDTVLLAKQSA
jgi:predicted transcriptional regulator/GNAT superfamily N-acetyltransferase